MLISKLPSEDKTMIADWIRWYGVSNREYNSFPSHRKAPVDYILREWEDSKMEYLWKMFGEQFIIEKAVSYERPHNLLESDICASLDNGKLYDFKHALINKVEEEYAYYSEEHRTIRRLMSTECLCDNRWTWNNIVIMLRGEKIAISNNAKVMKVLNKISKIVHLEQEFEEFRIAHSQILNQKLLTGTLCLSIHPFDFMTLSDNDYGWDSCMNWVDNGCYRTGTVEMMNSSCMIVAYLKGETPFRIDSRYWEGNKKWRELFVVHPQIICNVKSYPYHNDVLSQLTLEWLRELAAHNLGWDVSYDPCVFNVDCAFTATDKRDYRFNLYYNFMYNDFDTSNTKHYALIPQGWQSNEDGAFHHVDINLSGANICMCCGERWEPYEGREDQVLCFRCDPGRSCSCCGEEINDDDEYCVEGDILCRYCYEEQADRCMITEDYYYNDNLTPIYCVPVESDDNVIRHTWMLRSANVSNRYIGEGGIRHEPMFAIDSFRKGVDEYGNPIYYVYMGDCSNYTLEDCFGLWYPESRSAYINDYARELAEDMRRNASSNQ